MYKYQTIILINKKVGNQNKFSCEPVALSCKKIKDINRNKLSTKNSIPSKMLKISLEAAANISQKLLNASF